MGNKIENMTVIALIAITGYAIYKLNQMSAAKMTQGESQITGGKVSFGVRG